MRYKTIVVTKKIAGCCSATPDLDAEIEKACNDMANQGYVLITAYPEVVSVGVCTPQPKKAALLIFARQ